MLVTSIPKLLNKLSEEQNEKNQVLKQIADVSLLVLDDLGVERNTTYALEKIFEVVDTRYRAGKPIIIATNLQISEMKSCENNAYRRIYDRILHHCFPVSFLGKSRRILESEAKNKAMKNFLKI